MNPSLFNKSMIALATLGGIAVATPSFAGIPAIEAGTYNLDASHSKVGFEIPHLVVSSVEGRFNAYEGEVVLADKFLDSKVNVAIDAQSIDTGNAKRDEHLRSADFFDTSKYSKLTFKSKKITGTPENFKVLGDLTIKGVTKQVTLDGKYLGAAKDGFGNLKAAFQASTKISRKDFGLTWNKLVEASPAVGDEVTIAIKLQGGRPVAQKQ